jgi:DNA (cytosine-5)-methyltransferase 1
VEEAPDLARLSGLSVVYNEIEPYAAEWLRNLVAAGHIPNGRVDERSVVDLGAGDVGETFHAFAGIGVWAHALRRAGWPDDVPVWTGSCPCQPFSSAGRRGGFDDTRHLWPEWFRLIRDRRPPVVFGEQVASKDGLAWLDAVLADLEGENYAVRALDLCAAGVGAPHIRQRLYFVALADRGVAGLEVVGEQPTRREFSTVERGGPLVTLADREEVGCGPRRSGEAIQCGLERRTIEPDRRGPVGGFWSDAEWIPCTDGKSRPAQPGAFPLAHGVAGRVGKLRAYGNAIVAPLATEFIEAVMALALDEDQR